MTHNNRFSPSFIWNMLFAIFAITVYTACGGGGSGASDSTSETDTTSTNNLESAADEYNENTSVPKTHDCTVSGSLLEDNQVWLSDLDLLVTIKADSTTYDDTFGESHRIFEVYNTEDCSLMQRQTLPVNVSPDFPYYLVSLEINDEPIVLVRGFSTLYSYNPETRELSDQMEPSYRSERYGEDAQSGIIRKLIAWNDYVVGFARDYGAFVFDFSDFTAPEAVTAFAEYRGPDDAFHSLFILPETDGTQQILIPVYDRETKDLDPNEQLEASMSISENVPGSARNNRYLVLRAQDASRTPLAFDLEQNQRVELPANVASQNTQDILKWMQNN